jgi:hypothetical protein
VENLEMSTVGRGIWQKTENHGKRETSTLNLKNDEITEKREK